ncbi:m156 protein [Murid betaherpesvirus 1]|nr:m156 protein [Murid betaherpesvirus 1]DBA07676.1 TPA_asm: m156 [Murid betaherpesvirus 1]DBA08130.1 TPA_asm: m156 [Murid betaherpesvirus 1]
MSTVLPLLIYRTYRYSSYVWYLCVWSFDDSSDDGNYGGNYLGDNGHDLTDGRDFGVSAFVYHVLREMSYPNSIPTDVVPGMTCIVTSHILNFNDPSGPFSARKIFGTQPPQCPTTYHRQLASRATKIYFCLTDFRRKCLYEYVLSCS